MYDTVTKAVGQIVVTVKRPDAPGALGPVPSFTAPMVVSGDNFTVALRADGTVWTWGYNGYSQLGMTNSSSGNTVNQYYPVRVMDSAGANQVCIDRLIGHASGSLTTRTYTHKTIEELRQAIE